MFSIDGNEITITRGDTGRFDFTLENYTFQVGDQVYFTIKKSVNDVDFIVQKISTDFEGATAKFSIESDDTKTLKCGRYIYDIQCVLADGRVDTVITPSPFVVSTEVTW